MGIPIDIEPRRHLTFPSTPSRSPSTSSPLSYHQLFENRYWEFVAPISPPMSSYDLTSKTAMSPAAKSSVEPPPPSMGTLTSATAGQAPPRLQLPSLTSLFGPSALRPLRSPLTDHPASHSSLSPHERLYSSISASSQDRSYSSSSYFTTSTPTSSISQPRSAYESRFDDRSYGSLPRPSFSGPISPRTREFDHNPRHPEWLTGSDHLCGWPLHHGCSSSSSLEYSLGSGDPGPYGSSRETLDRLPGTGLGREDNSVPGSSSRHGEQRPPIYNTHHLPSTQSSSQVNLEGISVVKDGLGPKIWTGTHFLPRFVRAAEVPGEGMCYFYDDGSHCKTVIDGEVVNAHWGVTKAGKPRKRLAIACITCREKKIKCDPDYPRCVQCEKFGRVCKFKNAPRGGHNASPTTPPAETEDTRRLAPLSRPPPLDSRIMSLHSSNSVSPRTSTRPASPELSSCHQAKRMKLGCFKHYVPAGASPRSSVAPIPPIVDRERSWQEQEQPALPRIHEDVLPRYWQRDERPDTRT